MPSLVWHSSLGSWTPRRRPQSSFGWSATSWKCPPTTSCRPSPSPPAPNLRCRAPQCDYRRLPYPTRPESRCLPPPGRASHRGLPPRGRTNPWPLWLPRGVMDALGAQLDQGLGRLAVYRVAHARCPDRLAVAVQVAVVRLVDARTVVQALVYGDLRPAPSARFLPPANSKAGLSPPYTLPIGRPRADFSRRLKPLDHPSGLAVDPEKLPAISTSPP